LVYVRAAFVDRNREAVSSDRVTTAAPPFAARDAFTRSGNSRWRNTPRNSISSIR
jgi:hypothetical protein